MCVLSIKYIVLVLSREDEQINRLFGFVHHHKDIPFHLAFCPAARAKGGISLRRAAQGGFLARVCMRARQAVFVFCLHSFTRMP